MNQVFISENGIKLVTSPSLELEGGVQCKLYLADGQLLWVISIAGFRGSKLDLNYIKSYFVDEFFKLSQEVNSLKEEVIANA